MFELVYENITFTWEIAYGKISFSNQLRSRCQWMSLVLLVCIASQLMPAIVCPIKHRDRTMIFH